MTNIEGFERINQITHDLAFVPIFHDLCKGCEFEEGFMVADSIEVSNGFPLPVLIRHVIPVVSGWRELLGSIEGWYQGVAIYEIHNPKRITTQVKAWLEERDIFKISKRAAAIVRREGNLPKNRPKWWTYPYPVIDITQPYDLTGDIKAAIEQIIQEGENRNDLWPVYTFGSLKEQVPLLTYEQHDPKQKRPLRINKVAVRDLSEALDETYGELSIVKTPIKLPQ